MINLIMTYRIYQRVERLKTTKETITIGLGKRSYGHVPVWVEYLESGSQVRWY